METEVTISTQNGAPSREHNVRNPKVVEKEKHIVKGGFFEIWMDENPRTMYKELFGTAVKKYNERQKRPCRRIKNYYGRIEKSAQQKPVYELIAGVYCKAGKLTREEEKTILQEYVYGNEETPSWAVRNPNLILVGLYLHGDEESDDLHLHIDYIPVATGYTTSLETRTSLNGALEAMGYNHISKKQTMQIQWEKDENRVLEALCVKRELKVLHPDVDGRKHEDTERYKARMQKEALLREIEEIKEEQKNLSNITVNLIAPYLSLYMEAIDRISKMVNQIKKLEGIDELNEFGIYNMTVEHMMETIESGVVPRVEEQIVLLEGKEKLQEYCDSLDI